MSTGRSERRRMRRAMKEANRIAQERLDWQQGQMSQFDDMYGDLESRMIADAERGVQGDFQGVTDRAAADVSQQFGSQRDEERRRMAAFGLDPSGGRAESADRQRGLQQATATAGAVDRARRGEHSRARQEHMLHQDRAMRMGQNRFAMASQGVDAAYGGLQSERQNAAQTHAQTAAAQGQGMGQLIGTGAGMAVGMAAAGPMGADIGGRVGGNAFGGRGSTMAPLNTGYGMPINTDPNSFSNRLHQANQPWEY